MLLWIDTNAARSAVALRALCRLARNKGVEIVVHPQVYLERRRQERVRHREKFSEKLFDGFLRQMGIHVFEALMDQRVAGDWADQLARRYATHDAWEGAKKRTLGGELRKGFLVEPGWMPMSTDWLIALTIESDSQSWVITRDDGEEWQSLREASPRRALRWDEAMDWLETLPQRGP